MQTGVTPQQQGRAITFGPFSVHPERRLLLLDGKRIPIGDRALEILIVLLEHAGELVTKDQLVARAWPKRFVEESNLRVQVAMLRRALEGNDGIEYIATVPGRGYRFTATATSTEALNPVERNDNLPALLNPVIGRDDVVDILVSRLKRQRLVTVVGTGGIGKTTVALAAATTLLSSYRDGVWLADLAPITDAALIPSVLAAAIGLALTSKHPADELIASLRDRHMLIVLDNCERVIDATAVMAEAILSGAPRTTILATSREPLRSAGESVHRLSPLQTPPAAPGLTAAAALSFSAVEFFVERVTSSVDDFRLSDADAPVAADICRQLDGIALAIELAAAQVIAFGVRGVAERLGDYFKVLVGGRRTAFPRHQTLTATLDWSFALLGEKQRAVFRRLGAFAGGFSLESACFVAAQPDIHASEVPRLLADLVEKSLVAPETDTLAARYRLLDTTRAYALAQLEESAECSTVRRRHAECVRDLFLRSLGEWQTSPSGDWLASYRPEVDNLRLALDWAFSPAGDVAVGVSLTVAAIPLWFQLSLTDECRHRVGHALKEAGSVGSGEAHARQVMQLYATLGMSQTYTIGLAPQASAAWEKALEIAETLADREFQLEALWGLWFCRIGSGEYRSALGTAEEFRKRAELPSDLALAERLIGVPLHCLGDGLEARGHIERALAHNVAAAKSAGSIRYRSNQPLAARVTLAQMSWLEGRPERAVEEARRSIEEARVSGHAISLCDALAQAACPLAIFIGDWAMAEEAIDELHREATRHGLAPWMVIGKCWSAALQVKRGELDPGLDRLASGLDELRQVRFAFFHTSFLGTLAEGLALDGQVARAFTATEAALQLCEHRDERWNFAELLRIKGEVLRRGGDAHLAEADAFFSQALHQGGKQRALSWELRAATSLARLKRAQNRHEEAKALLSAVYGRFGEGFATRDLMTAKALIDELSS